MGAHLLEIIAAMTIGHIILVILGLLVAGGLLYGASRLLKLLERKDGPPDGEG